MTNECTSCLHSEVVELRPYSDAYLICTNTKSESNGKECKEKCGKFEGEYVPGSDFGVEFE